MIYKDIGNNEFVEYIKEGRAIILDIRSKEEYERVHIDGSKLIEFGDLFFEEEIDELDKEGIYLLYCRSGRRSKVTMELMREYGFEEVYNLKDGLIKWQGSDLLVCKEGLRCSGLLAY